VVKVSTLKEGQLVEGTITHLTKFGAFARLDEDLEGLIHISELSDQRINHPKEVVKEGDVVTLRVIKLDAERRRIGLSLRKVDSMAYANMDYEMMLSGQLKTDDILTEEEPSEVTDVLTEESPVEEPVVHPAEELAEESGELSEGEPSEELVVLSEEEPAVLSEEEPAVLSEEEPAELSEEEPAVLSEEESVSELKEEEES
jgi:small subunit ribosomal protein S1